MGQQQLLLLVLGIVIVGLAVVVGINAFSENRIKSNADALVTDGLRIASDAQAWALKPTQFGGGGGADALDDLGDGTESWGAIGYQTGGNNCAATEYGNVNGCFSLASDASACSTAPEPVTDGGQALVIVAENDDTGNTVCIDVSGTSSDNIGTQVDYGSGASTGS